MFFYEKIIIPYPPLEEAGGGFPPLMGAGI